MENLNQIFDVFIQVKDNFIHKVEEDGFIASNQDQTKAIFSDKWTEVERMEDVSELYSFQRDWFLNLYGFENESALKTFLADKEYIIDTGCGLGYKAAWFAELAPHATVIGIDISDAAILAAKNYKHISNLFFLKSDIAETGLKKGSIDFVVCDQVIMHTESPELTFKHLSELTSMKGQFACYVYRKKALPRELVDDYFRSQTLEIPNNKMWEFSEQLTVLGKTLSELKVSFISPDIPLLGIKGGEYDIQRFIYWNFLKCFWKDEWSFDLNKSTNYDWYAPSNAKRFSLQEFLNMGKENNMKLEFLHDEEACYSGRFSK
ncbi:class I SAM-dependent methyltransferase [Pedobacter flavus]|uniref:Class I SAM-dependent methyltransferase n=1 Tax=Pedobacter flavus TaxID=3113906 RepID=A0ABU7H0U4_9SPHI|nr:class I SAM-dependent methyltransferase [Pedobacter sp. VNH31]MEE1884702.1 class I SAM-dependent methyltransferase [Pedobacter sp. VNH31]